MLIKTVLNQLENFKGFVFGKVRLRKRWFEKPTLVVDILPRKGSRPGCPVCGRKRSVYDTSRSAREAKYLPLWSCCGSPQRSHFRIGLMAPPQDRVNGASGMR